MNEDELIERQQARGTFTKKTPIWQDAYAILVNSQWSSLDINGLNENVSTMSYYTALSMFISGGKDAVEARQALLFAYLKSIGFAYDLPTDGINKHYAGLPSCNLFVKRVVKNLCTNYINSPTRELQDFKTKEPISDEKQIEVFNEITKQTGFNYTLLNTHRMAKFTGTVAVHPRIRRNELQLQVLTPDQYQAVHDEYGNLISIYIPFTATIYDAEKNTHKSEIRYDYWDATKYQLLNSTGEPIPFLHNIQKYNPDLDSYTSNTIELTAFVHNYGRVPYEILTFNANDGDGTAGSDDLYELLKAQLACNALDYMVMENVSYSAIAMWVFTNFGIGTKARIAPGNAFIKEGVINPDAGDLLPPDVDTVSQQTYFDTINELKEKLQIQAMKNLGLPNSLILDNPGLASGEALKVDYRELEMLRREDVENLRPFEKRLLELTLIVANTDAASPYLGKITQKYEYSIDYKELYSNENTKDEIEIVEGKWQKGLLTPLEYLQSYKLDDTIETDEQAIEFINKNLEYKSLIKGGMNDATGSGEAGVGTGEQRPGDNNTKDEGTENGQPFENAGGSGRANNKAVGRNNEIVE